MVDFVGGILQGIKEGVIVDPHGDLLRVRETDCEFDHLHHGFYESNTRQIPHRILEALSLTRVRIDDVLYVFGSGAGLECLDIAKLFPNNVVTGIGRSPFHPHAFPARSFDGHKMKDAYTLRDAEWLEKSGLPFYATYDGDNILQWITDDIMEHRALLRTCAIGFDHFGPGQYAKGFVETSANLVNDHGIFVGLSQNTESIHNTSPESRVIYARYTRRMLRDADVVSMGLDHTLLPFMPTTDMENGIVWNLNPIHSLENALLLYKNQKETCSEKKNRD